MAGASETRIGWPVHSRKTSGRAIRPAADLLTPSASVACCASFGAADDAQIALDGVAQGFKRFLIRVAFVCGDCLLVGRKLNHDRPLLQALLMSLFGDSPYDESAASRYQGGRCQLCVRCQPRRVLRLAVCGHPISLAHLNLPVFRGDKAVAVLQNSKLA